MEKIAVVIPAYNEEDSISLVLKEVQNLNKGDELVFDCVVINDCSTDRTGEIAEKNTNAIVLHLPIQLGIGGAIQTGLTYALEHDYSCAIQLDGDGQHIAAEIPKLLHAYHQGYDIVIGSRFIDKSGFQSSAIRRAGIGYFKYLIKLLTKQLIRDCTSGFRLFNKEAMALAAEYYPDEYPEPEAIVLFTHAGLKIGEVPVRMRKRQGGKSSIGFFNSIYYMFKVSLAIVFTYIRTQNLKKS